MPPNINRYILRTVDIDTVHSGDKAAYVYSKMGRIVLVGFIEMPHPREWKGSKLHVKKGVFGSKHYILPSRFGDYFINKAKRLITIQKSMSENQRKKNRWNLQKRFRSCGEFRNHEGNGLRCNIIW